MSISRAIYRIRKTRFLQRKIVDLREERATSLQFNTQFDYIDRPVIEDSDELKYYE